jgi:hypothetical protein
MLIGATRPKHIRRRQQHHGPKSALPRIGPPRLTGKENSGSAATRAAEDVTMVITGHSCLDGTLLEKLETGQQANRALIGGPPDIHSQALLEDLDDFGPAHALSLHPPRYRWLTSSG